MPKARVYELAKELGVDSKTVLAKLKDMGEFVKSASSTVEAPVIKKLRAQFPSAEKQGRRRLQTKSLPKEKLPKSRTATKSLLIKAIRRLFLHALPTQRKTSQERAANSLRRFLRKLRLLRVRL